MQPKANWPPSKAIDSFLNEADISTNSISVYKGILISFIKYLYNNKLEYNTLQKSDFITWKKHCTAMHSPKTVNLYQSVLRRFYKWLSESGICSNVSQGIKLARLEKNYTKYPLTKDQILKLLHSIGNQTPMERRNHCLINLMILTGLRRCEVNRLDINDLTTIQNVPALRIQRKGHTHKDQFKVISQDLANEIKALILDRKVYKPEDPLFVTMQKGQESARLGTKSITAIVKQYLQGIGLNGKFYTAHSLRHTAAVLLLSNGFDLHYTMLFLGHSSTNTTQIYTKYVNEVLEHSQDGVNTLQNLLK